MLVRFALRALLRAPRYLALSVLLLACGIGATTAVFSVVDSALLKPLPFTEPERLVALWATNAREGVSRGPLSAPDVQDVRRQSGALLDVALYSGWTFNLSGAEDSIRLEGANVTPGLFDLLGVRPLAGRLLAASDALPGAAPVALLGHALWKRRFGGELAVVGRILTLNGAQVQVVGVLPPGFAFPGGSAEVWTALDVSEEKRGSRWLSAVARLAPGIPLDAATTRIEALAQRLALEEQQTNAGWSIGCASLHDAMAGAQRPALLALLTSVGLLLLIACANLASLTLVRGLSRQRELAIRAALGADRRRLVGQLLCESALIALAGGALGSALAVWLVDALQTLLPPEMSGVAGHLDARALLICCALSVATALLIGLLPALRATRLDASTGLRDGGAAGRGHGRFYDALVAGEVALSAALLVTAGLLAGSFLRVRSVDPGFDAQGVLTAQMVLTGPAYSEPAQQDGFVAGALSGLRALPGATEAAASSTLPVGGDSGHVSYPYALEGEPLPLELPEAHYRAVTASYFSLLRIPLLDGRAFTDADLRDGLQVAIVNRTLARKMGGSPIGRRVRFVGGDPQPWMTIVGVAGDVKQSGLERAEGAALYLPYAQRKPWMRWISFMVRTAGEPGALAGGLRRVLHALDGDQAPYGVVSMERVLSGSLADRRVTMEAIVVFSAAALLLTFFGLYAVVSIWVRWRTHELGVRLALGAPRFHIVWLVVGRTLVITLAGLAGGILVSIAAAQVFRALLFGVSPTEPAAYAGVMALLLLAALLASAGPARRACLLDPAASLREG